MTDHNNRTWKPVLDHMTPFSALDTIADELAADSMNRFRETLNADPELSFEQRAKFLRAAWPKIRARTRQELQKGWERCKLEMGRPQ